MTVLLQLSAGAPHACHGGAEPACREPRPRHRWRATGMCLPAIRTTISSRCHRSLGRARRCRSFLAIIGPNFSTQRRTVSYETSSPRSARRSSTFAVTKREAQIQPDRVLDERRRKPMSAIREMGHAGRYPIGISRATRCRDNARAPSSDQSGARSAKWTSSIEGTSPNT
jgi:hypothetical protein